MARSIFACSLVGMWLNLNNTAKYVELSVEDLRTRVRFPPAPPYTDAMRYQEVLKVHILQGFGLFLCLLSFKIVLCDLAHLFI